MLFVLYRTVQKGLTKNVSCFQRNGLYQIATRQKNTTINDTELEKHTKLEKEWWSTDGILKALHDMNEIRIPVIRDGILGEKSVQSPQPLAGVKILDVGCGGGILSEPLARLGAEVTGVDASEPLIELAKNHAKKDRKLSENNPNYICNTIEDHSSTHKNHYDAVVASEIIEHITNKELFVQSCTAALKPGGSIFFTTPNKTNLCWLCGVLIAENVLKIIPRGHHDWNMFTTPTELSHLVEKNNCRVKSIYGGVYSVFNKKWYLTSNQDLLFLLHGKKSA